MPLGDERFEEEMLTATDAEKLANIERARRIAFAAQLRTPSPPRGAPAVGTRRGVPGWFWVLAVVVMVCLIALMEQGR